MNLKTSHRRVLLISPQPFYEDRGTPIAVRHVVTALSQLGWSVDILTYGVGQDFHLPHVRIFRFGGWLNFKTVPIGLSLKKVILDSLMPIAILRRLVADDYDCIHAVEEAIYPALLFGRLARVPVIYDMQSSIPEQLSMYPWLRFLRLDRLAVHFEKLAYKRANVVACSAGLAHNVLGRYGGIHASEWIFPNCSNEPIEKSRAEICSEFQIPASRKIVVYTGNFERYQGIGLLLSAYPRVLEAHADTVFVLVGGSENEIAALSRRHADVIESGHLVLIPRQSRHSVREILSVSDIAVSPRVGGSNLPLKVFDYLAAGLPVVASDIPAHRAFAEDALELVGSSPSSLSEGILNLLKNADLKRRYRNQAREITNHELAWSNFRAQVKRIYEATSLVGGFFAQPAKGSLAD